MKKRCLLVLLMVMLLSLVGCGSNDTATGDEATEEETYLIASYMPMTGNNASHYMYLVNSQDLAAEYINANGGFNGAKVEFERYDTTSSNEEAAKIAQLIVEEGKAKAVLPSPMSNEIKASATTLDDAHLPTIVVGTSTTLLTENNWDYVYRVALNTDFTLETYYETMEKLGYTKLAIIYSQEEVAVSIKEKLVEQCPERGIEIVALESVDATDTDFTAACLNVVNSNPDIVCQLVVSDAGGGTCVKQLRQNGYDGLIIHREIFSSEFIKIGGAENMAGSFFPSLYVVYENPEDCEIEKMREFLEAYAAKYGSIPDYDWAYRAYDQVMTLWEASKIAGTNDPEAVKAALDTLSFEALGGTIDFTSGNHEGYSTFGCFMYDGEKMVQLDNWLTDGSYDAFLTETGREK